MTGQVVCFCQKRRAVRCGLPRLITAQPGPGLATTPRSGYGGAVGILKVIGVVSAIVVAVLGGAIRLAPYLHEHFVGLRRWRREPVRARIYSWLRQTVATGPSRVHRS